MRDENIITRRHKATKSKKFVSSPKSLGCILANLYSVFSVHFVPFRGYSSSLFLYLPQESTKNTKVLFSF